MVIYADNRADVVDQPLIIVHVPGYMSNHSVVRMLKDRHTHTDGIDFIPQPLMQEGNMPLHGVDLHFDLRALKARGHSLIV